MSEPIYRVDTVTIETLESNPPVLEIHCIGTASSAGWTNVRLEPYVYTHPPADGIQDFSLVGDKPTGVSAQMLSRVKCVRKWRKDGWIKGVRIHAKTNTLEKHV